MGTVKRIWILSELYYPEESATGYYLTRIAEGLAAEFDVRVISAQPTYLARGTRAPRREVHNGVKIRRCAATTLNKNNLVFRFVNLVTISVSVLFSSIFLIERRDCVLAVTNPPTMPFVAALACWLRGARLVLKIEDLYPDALTAAGVVAEGSLMTRIFDRAQRHLCRFASSIVVLGRDTAEILGARYPEVAHKLVYIPHWADNGDIVPMARGENGLLAELGLQDRFVVQYSGNMGRTHDMESIVGAAELLRGDPRIHFLLIGWGGKERWLRDSCASRGLANVTILPPLPRGRLCTSLNAADLALITLVQGMLGVSVPSRLYNILAAGKPLIVGADERSEVARVVHEENVGWVVAPGSPQALADAIRNAMGSPGMLAEIAVRARRVAEMKYAPGDRYRHLFRALNGDSGHGHDPRE